MKSTLIRSLERDIGLRKMKCAFNYINEDMQREEFSLYNQDWSIEDAAVVWLPHFETRRHTRVVTKIPLKEDYRNLGLGCLCCAI